MNIIEYLKGKKAYVVAFGAFLTALGAWLGSEITTKEFIEAVFAALSIATLRAGIAKAQFMIPILALLIFTGCARFTTIQKEDRDDTKKTTTITTRATAYTFFEGRSALAQFKATQTEKSQSASVGSLSQEATSTNSAAILDKVTELIKAIR